MSIRFRIAVAHPKAGRTPSLISVRRTSLEVRPSTSRTCFSRALGANGLTALHRFRHVDPDAPVEARALLEREWSLCCDFRWRFRA
jgi:hypothetical protein